MSVIRSFGPFDQRSPILPKTHFHQMVLQTHLSAGEVVCSATPTSNEENLSICVDSHKYDPSYAINITNWIDLFVHLKSLSIFQGRMKIVKNVYHWSITVFIISAVLHIGRSFFYFHSLVGHLCPGKRHMRDHVVFVPVVWEESRFRQPDCTAWCSLLCPHHQSPLWYRHLIAWCNGWNHDGQWLVLGGQQSRPRESTLCSW